jgi:Skp family chaperone for outer membrane proteins
MMTKVFLSVLFVLAASTAVADENIPLATSDVEDNIRAMDTDHDGLVTVAEMRVFLEAKFGKGYERKLLDELQARAEGKSCSSPFTRSLY